MKQVDAHYLLQAPSQHKFHLATMKTLLQANFSTFLALGYLAALTLAASCPGSLESPHGLVSRDEDCVDCGPVCEGLTCSTICNGLGCGQTCRCTSRCALFCPNGDCNACCSCFETDVVGVGDVTRVTLITPSMSLTAPISLKIYPTRKSFTKCLLLLTRRGGSVMARTAM